MEENKQRAGDTREDKSSTSRQTNGHEWIIWRLERIRKGETEQRKEEMEKLERIKKEETEPWKQ